MGLVLLNRDCVLNPKPYNAKTPSAGSIVGLGALHCAQALGLEVAVAVHLVIWHCAEEDMNSILFADTMVPYIE